MKDRDSSNDGNGFRSRLIFIGVSLGIAWLLVIAGFLWWEIQAQRQSILELAATEARASYNKDLVYRRWAAGHGGTYVPITAGTPPSPYLAHIQERDITTPSGRALTLVNPAYMTRQVHELSGKQYGVKGHITSLTPLRPGNGPDAWEKIALEAFEKGATEMRSASTIGGIEHLRLMRPMRVEARCLKCHGYQGYEIGDLRGGISVSVPLTSYQMVAKNNLFILLVVHGVIFLLGLVGLALAFFHLDRSTRGRLWAERAFQESEEHLRAVYEAADNVAFVTTDIGGKDTRIIGFSPGAEKLFGYALPEIIGKSVAQLHPPGRDSAYPAMQELLRDGDKGFSGESVLLRKSGERFSALYTLHPLRNASGELIGALEVAIDITERKRSEEALRQSEAKFKAMFERAPLSYQSLDEVGNFIEVNATWIKALGYAREEVIGRNFSEFIHPDWREHFKQNFPRFKAVGEILGVEFEMVKKDGGTILVSFHGKIGKQPDGGFEQTHCIFQDITGQRQLEKEKEALEQRMVQMQKMESIGTLAGGIAHDFNNLLYSILGLSELLMDDLSPDSLAYEYAEEILSAGKRGSELVKQILTFSRQQEQKKIPIQLQQVLKEVLHLSRATIPADIEIREDIDDDCGWVLANATQVHQITMNLITNAYHAVASTSGEISVRLTETELGPEAVRGTSLSAGRHVELTISDTGHGIDAEIMEKVFDPYFTTKEKGKGTGLGLAVVYGIVKAHGGEVTISSAPGKGSRFTVYLPLAESAPDAVTTETVEEDARGVERVLLVDDDASIVKIERSMLERLGYRVSAYLSSREALEAFRDDPSGFDLVITDMNMPNITGALLAEGLLALRPDIPIIICTGFSDRIDREKAEALGFKGFLMKPIVRSDMARMIRQVLDQAR